MAHRSYGGMYPENTVKAIEKACDGANHPPPEMIEIDVQPTADGDVIVFHDATLDDLTDASGRVWKQDTATVTSATVLDSGATIPLLEDVLDAVPDHIAINIELKDVDADEVSFVWDADDPALGVALDNDTKTERRQLWEPFVQDVIETADRHNNPLLISSFFEGAIAATRDVAPDVPVAFLFYRSIKEGLDVTERYDCDAVHPPLDMLYETPFFNDELLTDQQYQDIDLVERAHQSGRDVNVWTCRTWYEAEQAREAQADGIITDYPLLGAWQ